MNVNGESPLSNVLTVYIGTEPVAPLIPVEEAISRLGSGSLAIQIGWKVPENGGAPITGYQLWMAENEKSFSLVYDGTQRADVREFTVTTGVTEKNTYFFKVRAVNFVGWSGFSPVLESFAAVPPSTPLEFAVIDSSLGAVTLSWREPLQDGGSQLTGYFVYSKKSAVEASWQKSSKIPRDFYSY